MAVHIQYMEAQAQELPLSEEHLDREEARTTCTNPSSRHMTCCAPPRPALGPGTSRPYAGGPSAQRTPLPTDIGTHQRRKIISLRHPRQIRHRHRLERIPHQHTMEEHQLTGHTFWPITRDLPAEALPVATACGSTTRSNGAVLRSGVIGQNLLPKWLTMAHSSKAKRLKSLGISRFRVERMTGVEP